MSKTLPPEIIRPIVLYLKDDKKSLHSCVLVSRDWCREAIRLLWRQPFRFLNTCRTLTFPKSKFKRPRCHCSKMKLKSQGGNLLMTYLSIIAVFKIVYSYENHKKKFFFEICDYPRFPSIFM